MADSFLNKTGLSYFWQKIKNKLDTKQDTLVSGTNIKTVNNTSLLGSGDIQITGGATTTGTVIRTNTTTETKLPNQTWTVVTSINLPPGTWVVTCGVRVSSNATGRRIFNLANTARNNSTNVSMHPVNGTVTQARWAQIIIVPEDSTNTYFLNAWQNSGSALTLPETGPDYGNFITAVRVI